VCSLILVGIGAQSDPARCQRQSERRVLLTTQHPAAVDGISARRHPAYRFSGSTCPGQRVMVDQRDIDTALAGSTRLFGEMLVGTTRSKDVGRNE
jgi:hypothetical protein